MNIVEIMRDSETFMSQPFSTKLAGCGVTIVLGLGITFLGLVVLMFSIKAMGAILTRAERKKASRAASAAVPVPAAPAVAPAQSSSESEDEEELIAVITAAVAAMRGNSSFVLKNVYRAPMSTGWNTSAMNEAFDSRKPTLKKRS